MKITFFGKRFCSTQGYVLRDWVPLCEPMTSKRKRDTNTNKQAMIHWFWTAFAKLLHKFQVSTQPQKVQINQFLRIQTSPGILFSQNRPVWYCQTNDLTLMMCAMFLLPRLNLFVKGYVQAWQYTPLIGNSSNQTPIWGFPKIGVAQSGCFILENPSINWWWGISPF